MKALLLSLLMLFTSLVPLSAQDYRLPPGKWWERPRIVEYLQLSPDQQKQIDSLVYEHARKMIGLNADLEAARLGLSREVDAENFDPAKVRAAFEVFQNARRMLETERFEMLLSVRQVLSARQWGQLDSLRRRMESAHKPGKRPPRQGPPPAGRPGPGSRPPRP